MRKTFFKVLCQIEARNRVANERIDAIVLEMILLQRKYQYLETGKRWQS